MWWSMKIEDAFAHGSFEGVSIITGRPTGTPIKGKAIVKHDDGHSFEVEVVDVQQFLKLLSNPIPGDNWSIMLDKVYANLLGRTIYG